ncbi:hypothetical protein M514_04214 [Trichuris suis]|uniref:Uncharacterized protein n=1 Tax=Trichuris suis TaxID=68888 RepID=A0A085NRN4_9BILA|nr:hypothetical protein M513_04214 [Trichuris suis]KFD72130.1 hypothetical protein M514_04214 [Trichuris suis]
MESLNENVSSPTTITDVHWRSDQVDYFSINNSKPSTCVQLTLTIGNGTNAKALFKRPIDNIMSMRNYARYPIY